MNRVVIEITDRYGRDWWDAPDRIILAWSGNEKSRPAIESLAQHLAHVAQEWAWPGQEHMFEAEGRYLDCQDCRCISERRERAEAEFRRLKRELGIEP